METARLTGKKEDIERAAQIIRDGGLVAFPTETVYGLGADAMNPDAVREIYRVKGRPSDNPSIVHISHKEDLEKIAVEVTEDMRTLLDKFCPGPITMIVKARPEIPKVTTGGLDTVGVRMPESQIARDLISCSGRWIAAPSANISGKPSPTRAEHVIHDFDGRIEAVIDGGACSVGIESTVIDMTGNEPVILRPGIVTLDDFKEALGRGVSLDPALSKKSASDNDFVPRAPGQKYRHYAPDAPMILFTGMPDDVDKAIEEERARRESKGEKVYVITFDGDEKGAAHDLFAELREADRQGADIILAAALEEKGVGFSVMNRLLKSCGYRQVQC